MFVEQMMKKEVYTLQSTNTLNDAFNLMNEKKIRHIPIVDENKKLCGIVTSHDVNNALPSSLNGDNCASLYDTPIESFMTKDVIVGHPLDFVEEVAVTFFDSKISCLPIVSRGELVGIVTTTDLLYAYIKLTGSHQPSSKIDIRVTDRTGTIADVTQVFKRLNANVLSILVYPDFEDDTHRILSIRVTVINPLPIINELQKEGFQVLWPNLPGVEL